MREVGTNPPFIEKCSIGSAQVLNTPADTGPVLRVPTSDNLQVTPGDIFPVTDLVVLHFPPNIKVWQDIFNQPGRGLQVRGFPDQGPTLLG